MLVLSALGKLRQGIRSSLGSMERPYLKKRRDKCLFKIFYLCVHALGRWGCVHVGARMWRSEATTQEVQDQPGLLGSLHKRKQNIILKIALLQVLLKLLMTL